MLLKITSDNKTLAENKVLILYILSLVNKPITNDTLYTILSSALELNYFYFEQFLLDLINVKYVISYKKDTQVVYELTEAGRNTLNLTLDILPGIVKLKVDTNIKSQVEDFENEESIVSEFIPKNENEYEVYCRIIDQGEIVFEIKTIAYSREQAQHIVDNWKKNANVLYPKLLKTMTE